MGKRFSALINTLLQPGAVSQLCMSRFNGFAAPPKPLKRFPLCLWAHTGLKPCVNESGLWKTASFILCLVTLCLFSERTQVFAAEAEDG